MVKKLFYSFTFFALCLLLSACGKEKVLFEKLRYIHENPVRAGLCKYADDYKYSSALFYTLGKDNWGFLTHLRD